MVVPTEAHSLMLAGRNIPGVTVLAPEQLNVYDVLNHKQLVLLEGVIESVTARLSGPAGETGDE